MLSVSKTQSFDLDYGVLSHPFCVSTLQLKISSHFLLKKNLFVFYHLLPRTKVKTKKALDNTQINSFFLNGNKKWLADDLREEQTFRVRKKRLNFDMRAPDSLAFTCSHAKVSDDFCKTKSHQFSKGKVSELFEKNKAKGNYGIML